MVGGIKILCYAYGLTKREMEQTVSVVRRFGGEPQLISNGSRCPMDIESIGHRFPLDINFHWTSITRSPTNRRTTVLSHKNFLKDNLSCASNVVLIQVPLTPF